MAYSDKSLKKKHKGKSAKLPDPSDFGDGTDSIGRLRIDSGSPGSSSSRKSVNSTEAPQFSSLGRKLKKKRSDDIEMGIKNVEVVDDQTTIHTVEVLKRPGQTLGFYIREGDGKTNKRGVFISRIAEGSIVQKNGLLRVGDEIQMINSVNVTRTNLDDVVVLMSIPKKLILTIRSRRPEPSSACTLPRPPRKLEIPNTRPLSYEGEINPEDSNDSGLSSEHSLKGEKLDPGPGFTIPPPNQYATVARMSSEKPSAKQRCRTDMCVSDGEHEYTPKHEPRSKGPIQLKTFQQITADAYNSDSELLHRPMTNPPRPADRSWIGSADSGKSESPRSPPMSNEMKHWLRKFDTMSQELKGPQKPPDAAVASAAAELEGYRNELWRQERLLNDAIHNMESALSVDNMLQQSTHSSTLPPPGKLTDSLATTDAPASCSTHYDVPRLLNYGTSSPNHTAANSQNYSSPRLLPGYYQLPAAASAYSYLRDLPLLIKTPMKIHIDEFTLYRPEYDSQMSSSEAIPVGDLKVKIYCGHGLKSSKMSLRDLYCVFQLDNVRKAKTMIRTGAINFDWDECFDLEMTDQSQTLGCMIYHWNAHSRHRLCFTGQLKLARLFSRHTRAPQNVKCALKLEPRGILYLEISYRYSSSGSDEKISTLFGRSLKETIEIEHAGTNVPMLVAKCITEIKNRGLAMAGLYRLCGAAKKKNQLRQEFERHPSMIDLSPNNVADVHVITGLLKDYLRELPESLLTLEAYSVAEKALTRESVQDCDQDSLEIVQAFVASLHPWQQGTVVYLLNHLHEVSLHCTENKMNTSNLAVCFGPILAVSGNHAATEHNNVRSQIDVIRYLLDIWPQNFNTNNNIIL